MSAEVNSTKRKCLQWGSLWIPSLSAIKMINPLNFKWKTSLYAPNL